MDTTDLSKSEHKSSTNSHESSDVSVKAQPTKTQPRLVFRFTELRPEIRYMIYKHALKAPFVLLRKHLLTYISSGHDGFPDLLNVSKAIRAEAF
jgi:hypothetical protein